MDVVLSNPIISQISFSMTSNFSTLLRLQNEVTGILRPTLSNSHPASKLGLIPSLSTVLVRSWACPRPERFPTPRYQVMNNNIIQGRVLQNVIHCRKSICPIKAICDWQVLANHIRGRQPNQNPKQALRAQIL